MIWRPRAGWFGVVIMDTEVTLGTGGTSIGNSTTTSVLLPVPGGITTYPKCVVELVSLNMQALVAGAMASGTILASAFKRNNQGTPADVAMTASLSLGTDIVTTTDWTYAWPLTNTKVNNTFKTTDACRIDIVTTGTVNTQPTVTIAAIWEIRRVG